MKKIITTFFILSLLTLTGCDKEKPILVTNSKPITKETVNYPVQNFAPHQRINYALIVPKGFTDSVIRMQIIKKSEKSAYWGYSAYQGQDINVEKGKQFYIGYTTIPEVGYYIMRFFEIKNLDKEIAKFDFWVK